MNIVPKYNILMLSAWYPTDKNPFLGIFVKRHAEAIALKHNVYLLHVTVDNEMKEKEFRIQKKQSGQLTEIIIYYGKSKRKSNLFNQIKNYNILNKHYTFGLNKYLESDVKFDLVHLNIAWPLGLIAKSISDQLKIPAILSEHWTGYLPEDGRYKGAFLKYVTKKIVKRAKAITTVSNHLANQMISHGLKGNYITISNVVDTELFSYKKNDGNKVTLIHVSSLDDAQKNVTGLLKAFQKIKKKHNELELIIVGAGHNEQVIKRLSNELGLTTRGVTFVGQKTENELADYFQQSDALILNSLYENQPVVMLEALCCGIPVISSEVGGISENINPENGILFKPNDENELVQAIENYIIKKDSYNSLQIQKWAMERYSKNIIADEFDKLFQSVVKK